MKVRNPKTGIYDYKLKEDSQKEIEQIAKSLRKNQPSWESIGIEKRSKFLLRLADNLESNMEALLDALGTDTGRIRITELEISGALGLIRGRAYSTPNLMKLPQERPSFTSPSVNIQQQWVPYPLVGAISPWNFPLLLALIDAIPALLAGCAVLLKPSEVTPRFIDVLEISILKIPELAGVFGLIRGGKEAGQKVVDLVDVVCFTGSVSTGQHIAKRCAERFIPAFLELGGKDPAIVLAEADLDVSTDAILRSGAGATGQACQSLERVYVHDSIYSSFVKMLVDKIRPLKFNNEMESGSTLGPLIFEKQAKKIQIQIGDAIEKGAKIEIGGEVQNVNGGLYMIPTVLTSVDHSMEIMKEETFGPVIPIMKFSSIDEGIRLANDSQFGLSASVFSQDENEALVVASQIDAGGISINDASLTNKVFDAEKNAFKMSGLLGSRMGADGFLRFFRKKAMLIQKGRATSIHEQAEN